MLIKIFSTRKSLVHHVWDSYKGRTSTPRKRGQTFTTIKAPIPSQIKVHIIYPSLALQSCENSSNLTFGGFLASTTPVLSVRSFSLFFVGIVTSVQGSCSSLVIFTASSRPLENLQYLVGESKSYKYLEQAAIYLPIYVSSVHSLPSILYRF